ncbi:3-oxoacyl-[acyl-carrier-protein] synthase 3 [uncultured Ruminococcus sp.]|nr:3-oxoacyl-[acyl-carrier-protein] synthase 3 [uncultured Ruminococcus sp.]
MMIGKICGTGSSIPVKIMDNDDLSNMVDTNDAWIRERTGVEKRHIAESESTVSMAVEAGRQALAQTGVRPEELDMIVVSTMSPDAVLPCTACEVQKAIGAEGAVCFDLQAACTGFIFAYNTAQAYIQSNMCRTVLLIGSERLSRLVDWTDRGTCILFGDGAGAAVLKAAEGRAYLPVSHSDGKKGEALTCDRYIHMDGRAVFQFAVTRVPEVIREVLTKNELLMDDIDYFVLHQANRRIVEAVAKRLRQPIEKFPMNLQEYGNTSSASIPILLDEMNRSGKLKKGQKLVVAGFGAGLSWGASIVEW